MRSTVTVDTRPVRRILGALVLAAGLGAEFQIAGEIVHREALLEGELDWYQHTTNAQSTRTTSFFIRMRDCKWDMELESTSSGIKGTKSAGCDGNDIYSIHVFKADALSPSPGEDTNTLDWKGRLEDFTKGAVPLPAVVIPGIVPEFDVFDVNLLWLVYCSGCYFSGGSNAILPAPSFSYVRPEMIGSIATHLTWDTADTNCLVGLVALRNGNNHPSLKDTECFRYAATSMTNLASQSLPLTFEFMWPKPAGGSKGPPLRAVGRLFRVEHLKFPITGRPKLTRKFSVRDFRARSTSNSVDQLVYTTTSDWWQPNEERFKRALREPGNAPPAVNLGLLIPITAAVMITIYASVIFWHKRR